MDTVCGVHILCATFWRVFDYSHCLRLTEVSLPQEVECLPLNCFQFYPCRLSSNDMSMVLGCSVVKLASAMRYPFHATRWKLLLYMCCRFQEKKMALPVILCCVAFIFVMTLILFRHLGGDTLFWVVRCPPIMLLGDRALFIISWSPRIHYVISH